MVQAAALDRVVQVARAVRGEDDDRRVRRADRAELGDRHARLGEQLEEEGLEVVVGAVDLVDQEHRAIRSRLRRPFRLYEYVLLFQLGCVSVEISEMVVQQRT